ncbi:hypothetical protein GCM10012320_01410 [Sinomonas cellulolyticus]|nr:hypothetical protein GCM10012320_01410 [Sinomonas sp. KCTC 49339]
MPWPIGPVKSSPGAVGLSFQMLTWGAVSLVLVKVRSGRPEAGADAGAEGEAEGVDAAAAPGGRGKMLERATPAPATAPTTASPAPWMKWRRLTLIMCLSVGTVPMPSSAASCVRAE